LSGAKSEKSLSKKLPEAKSIHSKLETKMKGLDKSISFYEENGTCPTCTQTIDENVKNTIIVDRKKEKDKIESAQEKLSQELETLTKQVEDIQSINAKIAKYHSQIMGLQQLQKSIRDDINRISSQEDTIEESTKDLEKFKAEEQDAINKKKDLSQTYDDYKTTEELLKDRGIKSKIIRQYLPVMNKLINKYLQCLDFFVNFHLDENFKETVKSRHRDEFMYQSFSEGQKFRIDISILLAWREIARLKNSTNTNLLILDEVFDSSLDSDGVDEFMKLLHAVSKNKTNIFVMSHRGNSMIDKFDRVMEFTLTRNFTTIKDIT
jgi:DNA repair exonuclease SbcCD ATPase subunit